MSPVPLDVPFTVATADGNILEVVGRARARNAARSLSRSGQRAVVVQRGRLIACASNGRMVPHRWFSKWPPATQQTWMDLAPRTEPAT